MNERGECRGEGSDFRICCFGRKKDLEKHHDQGGVEVELNSKRAAESPLGSQCWEIIWGEGMGTQNGKEYQKAFYRDGDFVKFSCTLG